MCRLSRKIAQRSQETWCNATINATIGYCTRRSTGCLWTHLRLNLMHSHALRPRQRGGVTGPAIERRMEEDMRRVMTTRNAAKRLDAMIALPLARFRRVLTELTPEELSALEARIVL